MNNSQIEEYLKSNITSNNKVILLNFRSSKRFNMTKLDIVSLAYIVLVIFLIVKQN